MPAIPLVTAYSRGRVPRVYAPQHFDLEFGAIERALPSPLLREVTASTRAQNDDGVILCDATSGAITVTLGSASTASGHPVVIKKTDASANAVTIGGTVDGVLNRTLVNQHDSIIVQSDGTTWFRPILTGPGTGGTPFSLTAGTYLTGGPFNGSSAVTLATNATALNTVSTLVARDASGNFAAGVITANLTGNASGTAATVTGATQAAITSAANLATVGALNAGSITSGFGSINVGADAISGGAFSGTALSLTAAEGALSVGTQTVGALAQVSGAALGFDIFTPTANITYYLVIRGQDVASGAPTNGFMDVVLVISNGTVTPTVITSTTAVGAPGARTYSNNVGALKLAVANGTTWYIDPYMVRFPG